MPSPIRLGDIAEPSGGVRCGRDDLGAHAAALHGLDDRIDAHLSGGSAGDLLGQFAPEVDELLDQERSAARVFGQRGEPVVRLGRRRHDADALAVVSAAGSLDHGSTVVAIEEALEIIGAGHGRPLGLRHPELLQAGAHEELVLREAEGARSGSHGDAGLDERREHLLRNVLVVEREHVDAAGELEHGVGVSVVADRGGGQSRRHAVLLGEHAEIDPHLDGGRDHHARQLTTADDSDSQRHEHPSVAPCPSIIPQTRDATCTATRAVGAGARCRRRSGGNDCASRCARI